LGVSLVSSSGVSLISRASLAALWSSLDDAAWPSSFSEDIASTVFINAFLQKKNHILQKNESAMLDDFGKIEIFDA
jgi:hypothetical protein